MGGGKVSVLQRPQQEWDDFIERASRPRTGLSMWKLLWVLIPAGVVALIVVYYLGG
jgi:hypothetical protein